jgi:hypothetical protein
MKRIRNYTSSIFVALVFVLIFAVATISSSRASPQQTAVIDFEGIPEGTIVDQVFSGFGISGEVVEGEVLVSATNPELGEDVNAAMIFDASCLPGGTAADCTGNDSDLFWPENGNILIISEDLDSSDPDDADVVGATYHFDFSGLGSGTVTVFSISVLDVETEEQGDANIELFADGVSLGVFIIPETGDGEHAVVPIGEPGIGISGVDQMIVDLDGSGAITNLEISPEVTDTPTPTPTDTPTATPTEPTAVELVSFDVAGVSGQQVSLAWETAAEVDNYGFRLYRSPDSNFANASLVDFIPAAGGNAGNTYSYTDEVPNTGQWWYWLSDIDTAGRETIDPAFNPVSATVTGNNAPAALQFQIFLPISVAQSQR